MKRLLSILASVLLISNSVLAQHVGDRVRVTVASARVTGSILKIDDRELIITTQKSKSSSIAIDEIIMLERSLGKRRNIGKGLLIGGVSGTIGGLLLGTALSLDEDDELVISGIFEGVQAGIAWGMIGSASGFVIGAITRTEKWERVRIQYSNGRTLNGDQYLMLSTQLRF